MKDYKTDELQSRISKLEEELKHYEKYCEKLNNTLYDLTIRVCKLEENEEIKWVLK